MTQNPQDASLYLELGPTDLLIQPPDQDNQIKLHLNNGQGQLQCYLDAGEARELATALGNFFPQ